jgi:putative ABC transport system ATP-binding protein/lipoprotein-releasing system ATP-binding protein
MAIYAKRMGKEIGDPPVKILHDIDLGIKDGEFISISGRSGSGKSTLLYLLSTLDQPSSGNLTIDDKNIIEMSVEEVHRFRNLNLGFVFQFHYLLPELSALENVLMPARKTNLLDEKKEDAENLFKQFDIFDKMRKYPGQLSGGEQQRVAIARALIMKPRYLFADEPTGNLDTVNGKIVMNILKKANKEWRTTVILVTHEPEYAAMSDRIVFIEDGRIKKQKVKPKSKKKKS